MKETLLSYHNKIDIKILRNKALQCCFPNKYLGNPESPQNTWLEKSESRAQMITKKGDMRKRKPRAGGWMERVEDMALEHPQRGPLNKHVLKSAPRGHPQLQIHTVSPG